MSEIAKLRAENERLQLELNAYKGAAARLGKQVNEQDKLYDKMALSFAADLQKGDDAIKLLATIQEKAVPAPVGYLIDGAVMGLIDEALKND